MTDKEERKKYLTKRYIESEKEKEERKRNGIYTMDDPEYSTIPPVEYKMSEKQIKQLDIDYPPPDKASYLRFKCHYSGEEYFLISPYRSRSMNPYNEGFMVKPEFSKLKSVVFSCRSCYKDLCDKDEHVWINGIKDEDG